MLYMCGVCVCVCVGGGGGGGGGGMRRVISKTICVTIWGKKMAHQHQLKSFYNQAQQWQKLSQ